MPPVACVDCGEPYPESELPYCCPRCGGLFDFTRNFSFDSQEVDRLQLGIWKYLGRFGNEFGVKPNYLGEGNTPLLSAQAFHRTVHLKCELANPTGSFKDRGMATLVSMLVGRNITQALEDSSGNAGASFAAYAAHASIKANVYIPDSASGPKRKQIESYGAQVIPVSGPRVQATSMALEAAKAGMAYASHAYLPFNLPGYATLAYELVEQLGESPGAVLLPVGQGGLMLGIARGFQALLDAGEIDAMPVLIGIQSKACAPLVAMAEGEAFAGSSETIAEGVRVVGPLRANEVVKVVLGSKGRFVSVEESEIMAGRDALARLGFYVEPTSALIWSGLQICLPELPDPVVAILTGSGYKFQG